MRSPCFKLRVSEDFTSSRIAEDILTVAGSDAMYCEEFADGSPGMSGRSAGPREAEAIYFEVTKLPEPDISSSPIPLL